ncbi:hypothetical protein A6D6_02036 [Alcanivorax xiamenensis]|uniref:DUF4124 domain-containing protein n=1 Tax=Alcanivorax xiamenensis TaxID=1177156 RepID=A0ABQ6Y874_9GAMM|nr:MULTISPECIES: hypothetical protein [Alcanivorax]KAF0805775.1 hypothetical protein A6D6_02036 [Alcanivorax xiamenensis]
MRVTVLLLGLLLSVLSVTGMAANKTGQVEQRLYRYQSADGAMAISATLTEAAIHAGYQVLDQQGRVLETVAPAPPEEQARRRRELARQEQARAQARRDSELRRLYAGPGDAERARDRQLQALQLNIDYAENAIQQLNKKQDEEIHKAARAERAGREVPDSVRDAIERHGRQVRENREKIEEYQEDMARVREEFSPIIQRLRDLEAR